MALEEVGGGWARTVRAGVYPDGHEKAGKPIQFRLTLRTKDGVHAGECLERLLIMRDALVKAKRGLEAEQLIKDAALHVDEPELFETALMVGSIIESSVETAGAGALAEWSTWAQVGRAWLSGALARRFPHKKKISPPKTTTKENGIIDYLEPFIGHVLVEAFGVSDYNVAMGNLPERVKTDAARRHYHQVIMRVMRIALKCKLMTKWLLDEVEPVTLDKKDRPVFTCLFPTDLALLLPSPKVDYCWRLLWGFMVWESPRIGKLAEVRWHHIETDGNGAISMDSKSGEMLYWDLRPGTLNALLHLKALDPTLTGPFSWLEPAWQQQAAKILRKHLVLVGADDPRLHQNDGRRRKVRAHDTRATFVVFAKLEGRGESWIMDRTGHTSSEMIQRYDRVARISAGKGWTLLGRLDDALGVEAPSPPGPEPRALAPEAESHVAEAERGEAERGGVTTTVTDGVPKQPRVAGRGGQTMETTETGLGEFAFRCRDSNPDSGIQRPTIVDGRAQNTGGSIDRDTPEGTGSYPVSRPAVTPGAAFAVALKRAMQAAVEVEAFDELPALRGMFERASAAAGGAQVVELALLRRRRDEGGAK